MEKPYAAFDTRSLTFTAAQQCGTLLVTPSADAAQVRAVVRARCRGSSFANAHARFHCRCLCGTCAATRLCDGASRPKTVWRQVHRAGAAC